MPEVNWLAVAAAAFATFLIGGLWYGPLFGRAWMRASGVTAEQAEKGNMPLIFGVSFLLQLIAAAVLAMFIGPEATFGFAVAAAAAVGIFWVATAFGVVYLFEQRPMSHWLVNAGYHIVSYVVMGVILGLWR
jgi:hypothetical protein